jgi:hypothetical protein
MQVKHKYEVNTFNVISFILNKLQILKLFTGTIIVILLKKEDHFAFETYLF